MSTYASLFYVFAKIGLFTLGGGYAMLPLMEQEIVDKREWLSRRDFLDVLALAQAAPGIMAANVAVLAGYRRARIRGSVCALCGAVLPSFVIILLIALFFRTYQDNPLAIRIFKGIRPAVIALIAVPVFRLAQEARVNWKTIWLPVTAALLVWLAHVSPVYIILAAGVGGYWYAVHRETK